MEGTVMVSTGQVIADWSAGTYSIILPSDLTCMSLPLTMQTSMNVLKAQQVATRHV